MIKLVQLKTIDANQGWSKLVKNDQKSNNGKNYPNLEFQQFLPKYSILKIGYFIISLFLFENCQFEEIHCALPIGSPYDVKPSLERSLVVLFRMI